MLDALPEELFELIVKWVWRLDSAEVSKKDNRYPYPLLRVADNEPDEFWELVIKLRVKRGQLVRLNSTVIASQSFVVPLYYQWMNSFWRRRSVETVSSFEMIALRIMEMLELPFSSTPIGIRTSYGRIQESNTNFTKLRLVNKGFEKQFRDCVFRPHVEVCGELEEACDVIHSPRLNGGPPLKVFDTKRPMNVQIYFKRRYGDREEFVNPEILAMQRSISKIRVTIQVASANGGHPAFEIEPSRVKPRDRGLYERRLRVREWTSGAEGHCLERGGDGFDFNFSALSHLEERMRQPDDRRFVTLWWRKWPTNQYVNASIVIPCVPTKTSLLVTPNSKKEPLRPMRVKVEIGNAQGPVWTVFSEWFYVSNLLLAESAVAERAAKRQKRYAADRAHRTGAAGPSTPGPSTPR